MSIEFVGMTHVGCLGRVPTLMNLATFVYMIMNGIDYSIIHVHLTSKRGHKVLEFFYYLDRLLP